MKDTAVLFKTTVLITDKGAVVVDHESLPSKEVIKKLGKGYYPSMINAIVSHCKSRTHSFDEELTSLVNAL
tara:strand:- start:90 stop:302 length:213 start_codon:yes stop_codon:yes gene_type:complete